MLNLLADEIDAIGTKRYESQSGGEREIQRTMLELLNQMDGFDSMGDVKVPINLLMCMAIPQATWPDPIHLPPPPLPPSLLRNPTGQIMHNIICSFE